MYGETMRRQGAANYYHFPPTYWKGLLGLKDRLILARATLDGILVASILCFVSGPFVHYHLGASTDEARSSGANPLLFLRIAEWAAANGHEQFHLGGGVGASANSSLLTFKHRFYPEAPLLNFHVGKLIHDADACVEIKRDSAYEGTDFPPWRGAMGGN